MKYAAIALVFTVLSTGAAQAATFEAEGKGDTVTVYYTTTKKERCQIANTFSYVFEGKRRTTTQQCNAEMKPGKHLELCHVTHSDISEPRIEAPVQIRACQDIK
jgi:hypothetical protein